MKLKKYLTANIIAIVGIFIFLLFIDSILLEISFDYGNKYISIIALKSIQILPFLLALLFILLVIDIILNIIFKDKLTLNFSNINENFKYYYEGLFQIGFASSFVFEVLATLLLCGVFSHM